MSEFNREERYVVLKLKHMTELEADFLRDIVLSPEGAYNFSRFQTECVAVESDWPIYDQAWDMVKRMAECKPQLIDEIQQENEQLKARVAELEEFARDISDNYDCDEDAHRHGTPCRVCEAGTVLSKSPQQSLASIQADAVEDMYKKLCCFRGSDSLVHSVQPEEIKEYIQQLRNSKDT